MTRSVVWSNDAAADITQAVEFVSDTDPEYAGTLARTIRAAGDALGAYDTGRPGRMPGTREKSMTKFGYIICYHAARRMDGQITILRVIHARQDWPKGRWPKRPTPP